jgi:ribosomal protein S18 acetylase RimI-like enzyme
MYDDAAHQAPLLTPRSTEGHIMSKRKENTLELEWTFSQDTIDWGELSNLYKIAPLGEKAPNELQQAFSNSMYKCFVFDQGKLAGVGRALADGVDCSYICDVAVLPSHQGSGIGKSIVSKLVELSKGHKKIILYSYPGKESFYKKLGFKRMSTAMAIFENQSQALESGLINDT